MHEKSNVSVPADSACICEVPSPPVPSVVSPCFSAQLEDFTPADVQDMSTGSPIETRIGWATRLIAEDGFAETIAEELATVHAFE